MSLYRKAYRNDGDFSETLFWGSLEIVRIVDRLVSNYPDEILEKRGFSLFRHEYLLGVRYEDEELGGREGCDPKSRLIRSAASVSRPLKLVSQSHGGQYSLYSWWFSWLMSVSRFAVRVQLQRRYVALPLLKRIRGCNRLPRSFTVLLVLAGVLQSKLTVRDFWTVSLIPHPL